MDNDLQILDDMIRDAAPASQAMWNWQSTHTVADDCTYAQAAQALDAAKCSQAYYHSLCKLREYFTPKAIVESSEADQQDELFDELSREADTQLARYGF
jgi:hypothetical protein